MTLADYLAEAKLTQTEFAALVDAHPITVNRWVNGRALPRRGQMRAIERLTGGKVAPADMAAAAFAPQAAE